MSVQLEIIVVDDGSTDQTRNLLIPYQNRIHYIYKENGGACSARNCGLKVAKGEYVGFLDCDDLYLNDKIARSVAFLEDNPDFGFVHKALSALHLRYAQCYFLKNNYSRLREEFLLALKFNSFNFKAHILFFWFLFGTRYLRSKFHRKIVHSV